jgi:hypothetical protein
MLYSEIIAVCCLIHTRHIITLCEHNTELNIKFGGTWSNHQEVKVQWSQLVRQIHCFLQDRDIVTVCNHVFRWFLGWDL